MLNRTLLGVIAGQYPYSAGGGGGDDPNDTRPMSILGLTGRESSDAASSVVVPLPSTRAAGDFLVLIVLTRTGVDTPAGWDLFGHSPTAVQGTVVQWQVVFTRQIDGTESGSVTVNSSGGSGRMDWNLAWFRSARPLQIRDEVSSSGSETSGITDIITSTYTGMLLATASTIPGNQYGVGYSPSYPGLGRKQWNSLTNNRVGSQVSSGGIWPNGTTFTVNQTMTGLAGGMTTMVMIVG